MLSSVPASIAQVYSSHEGDVLVYDDGFLVMRPQVDPVWMSQHLHNRSRQYRGIFPIFVLDSNQNENRDKHWSSWCLGHPRYNSDRFWDEALVANKSKTVIWEKQKPKQVGMSRRVRLGGEGGV